MAKQYYINFSRLPTKRAHGLAIVKMCEAFTRQKIDLELIVPDRKIDITESLNEYYEVKEPFTFTKISRTDIAPSYRLGFLINLAQFCIKSWIYLRKRFAVGDYVYTRDPWIAFWFCVCRYPVVLEVHSFDGINTITGFGIRRAKRIIAITESLKQEIAHAFSVPEKKIFVAASGIELEKFNNPESKQDSRARLGVAQDAYVVMYIGALGGWKGTDTLFEASKGLPQSMQLVVVGGREEQIASLSKQYPHVTFLGFRPESELADNQQAADVLVVPNSASDAISAKYTSPLKVLAHMASGIPVIASDLPSIRELLSREAAYFFSPDDANSLRKTLVFVEGNNQQALSRAAQGKKDVVKYDWNQRAKNIVDFMRSQ